jgi:hypothetical protein
MAELDCAQLRELGPELALGVLAGRDRAVAIAHLQDCPACEQHIRELSAVGDRLVSLVPGAEPPVGFEQRVLARLGLAHPHRRRWRRWVTAAAAVLVAAALATAGWALRGTLHNDHDLATATITAGGSQVGEVFADTDRRPWLYVDVSAAQFHGTVTCQVQLADGRSLTVGSFPVNAGSGQWAGPAPLEGVQLTEVRLLAEDGSVLGSAHFG